MSILIQVGHNSSSSELLMKKLHERGLSEPLNSFSQNLTYQQVTDIIDKLIARKDDSEAVDKLTENVMVDFLLANLDSKDWGWEDEKNLAALSYWQKFDNDVRFILVFDHPKNLFMQLNQETLTTSILDIIMSDWIDYHRKMLEALELYQDKTILIEGKAGLHKLVDFKNKVQTLAPTLEFKSSWQIVMSNDLHEDEIAYNEKDLTLEIITEEILCKYPEAINIFNKLLSKSSIKCSENILKTKRIELDRLLLSFNSIKSKKTNTQIMLEKEKEKEKETERLRDNIDNLKKINNEIKRNLEEQFKKNIDNEEKLEKQAKSFKETLKSLKKQNILSSLSKINSIEKENKLLLKKLHEVQEDKLKEYLSHSNLNISQSLESVPNQNKTSYLYGAAERIKEDLPYRIGSIIIKKSKSPKLILSIPYDLAREFKDYNNAYISKDKLPKIEEYADAKEADKTKKHLSYIIGQSIIESQESNIKKVKLPFKLIKDIATFKLSKIK